MPALSLLYFFIIEFIVLMVLVFYYKGMLEKVMMQRTSNSWSFVIERIQLNAAHVQLLKKLTLSAFAETYLTIQSLECTDFWQKHNSETM